MNPNVAEAALAEDQARVSVRPDRTTGTLPPDLISDASRRLGRLGLIYVVVYALVHVGARALLQNRAAESRVLGTVSLSM
jgi:hypothetical protein